MFFTTALTGTIGYLSPIGRFPDGLSVFADAIAALDRDDAWEHVRIGWRDPKEDRLAQCYPTAQFGDLAADLQVRHREAAVLDDLSAHAGSGHARAEIHRIAAHHVAVHQHRSPVDADVDLQLGAAGVLAVEFDPARAVFPALTRGVFERPVAVREQREIDRVGRLIHRHAVADAIAWHH